MARLERAFGEDIFYGLDHRGCQNGRGARSDQNLGERFALARRFYDAFPALEIVADIVGATIRLDQDCGVWRFGLSGGCGIDWNVADQGGGRAGSIAD